MLQRDLRSFLIPPESFKSPGLRTTLRTTLIPRQATVYGEPSAGLTRQIAAQVRAVHKPVRQNSSIFNAETEGETANQDATIFCAGGYSLCEVVRKIVLDSRAGLL